jgi:hypothetical protein
MGLSLLLEDERAESGQLECSVRLHGDEHELDQVESVIYLLHSLTPHPLRHVRERSSGFRLAAIGRHVLAVHARVRRHDGSEEVLEH